MKNPITTIRTLWNETSTEMRKCTWPTRHELVESTVLVIVSLLIIGAFVAVVDWVSQAFIRFIT